MPNLSKTRQNRDKLAVAGVRETAHDDIRLDLQVREPWLARRVTHREQAN